MRAPTAAFVPSQDAWIEACFLIFFNLRRRKIPPMGKYAQFIRQLEGPCSELAHTVTDELGDFEDSSGP